MHVSRRDKRPGLLLCCQDVPQDVRERNAVLLRQSGQGRLLELALALDDVDAAGLVRIPAAAMLRRGELPKLDIVLRSASSPK